MPGPGFELPAPGARAEWLAVQRAGYLSEPCSALERVASLQALLDQLLQGRQPLDDLGVALGALLAEMYGELWRSEAVEQTLDALLPSVLEAGRGHLNDRIAVLALRSRMHLRFGRRAEGMALLAPISRLAEGSEDPLILAHRARTLGHAQAALQDWALAITHLREAQALAAEAGDGGRWVDMLITIAVAHRQLGEPQAELAALREGAELAETQRRWAGALNGWTGVAEACLQRQDLAAAQQAFERGQRCLRQAGGSAERLLKEQLAVQARLHAARGEYEPAIALMQEVLSQTRRWSMSRQLQHRMRQLVPWLAQAGRADEALALLEEAHGLALEELREAGRRDTAERLRQAELAQARSEQARSETHARELGRAQPQPAIAAPQLAPGHGRAEQLVHRLARKMGQGGQFGLGGSQGLPALGIGGLAPLPRQLGQGQGEALLGAAVTRGLQQAQIALEAQGELAQQGAGKAGLLVHQQGIGRRAYHQQAAGPPCQGLVAGRAPRGEGRQAEEARRLHMLQHRNLAVLTGEPGLDLALHHGVEGRADLVLGEERAAARQALQTQQGAQALAQAQVQAQAGETGGQHRVQGGVHGIIHAFIVGYPTIAARWRA